MENLVRRLGRMLTPSPGKEKKVPSRRMLEKMDRLEKDLAVWVEEKRWRKPTRTLGEVSEELKTDTVTLFHYFDQRVGMDFRTWRTRLRLEDACRLLLEEPDVHAADIGLRVGFSNRSNFARQFRAYIGCTPQEWRNKAGISHDIPAQENDYV